jgi:lysophospholipase L1-like esterase
MDILFLGHSLIEFFDWQGRFPAHRIANLGVAGETVEGLLSRLEGIIKAYPRADLIFIMTGINNVAMEDFDFLDPYREIINRVASAYPNAKIYIQSLLPTFVDFIENESVRQVNISIKNLAKDTGVEFIDLYRYFIDRRGMPVREYLLDDGVHLTDKGYSVWAGVIEKIIAHRTLH